MDLRFHLPALASNAGGASLTGTAVDLSALASNAGGLTVKTALLLQYLNLQLVCYINLLAATTVDAPILVTATGNTGTAMLNIGRKSGATLHVGSLTATEVLAAGDWANLNVLQLNQQASD